MSLIFTGIFALVSLLKAKWSKGTFWSNLANAFDWLGWDPILDRRSEDDIQEEEKARIRGRHKRYRKGHLTHSDNF